jgi:hypothetical protein
MNFAPSQKMTPCKESTLALATQARKYGLGMIFATQTPKAIDNKIISNCTTHFYGKMNAPATIQAVRELIAMKGGSADDVAGLSAGVFYFATEGTARPIKMRAPLWCASKARITCGGRFHPESCRLIWKLTSGLDEQSDGPEPRDKGRLGRLSDPAGCNASEA